MTKLYSLTISAHLNNRNIESFHIGIFGSSTEALHIANIYQKTKPGFMHYNCQIKLDEIIFNGNINENNYIYQCIGWNETDEIDEIDTIESDYYDNEMKAEIALDNLKNNYFRKEWVINKYKIGQCEWNEGFKVVTIPNSNEEMALPFWYENE